MRHSVSIHLLPPAVTQLIISFLEIRKLAASLNQASSKH